CWHRVPTDRTGSTRHKHPHGEPSNHDDSTSETGSAGRSRWTPVNGRNHRVRCRSANVRREAGNGSPPPSRRDVPAHRCSAGTTTWASGSRAPLPGQRWPPPHPSAEHRPCPTSAATRGILPPSPPPNPVLRVPVAATTLFDDVDRAATASRRCGCRIHSDRRRPTAPYSHAQPHHRPRVLSALYCAGHARILRGQRLLEQTSLV